MAGTSEARTSRSTKNNIAGSAYDVFVSFRGSDTRYGITDVLYETMKDKGIHVFRDTDEIRHGEEIGDELCRAVPDSRIYIVVFSWDYASSVWCLRELTMMVDCIRDSASGKVVLPIFYEVTPGDVKLKTDLYRGALDKHKEKYKEEDVKKWEKALKKVGGISGLEYKRDMGYITNLSSLTFPLPLVTIHVFRDVSTAVVCELFHVFSPQFVEQLDPQLILGRMGKFVSDVVADIREMLTIRDRILPDHLIGMDERVENVMGMLNLSSHVERHVVIVHGMGGIGKTTLANVIFNRISPRFDGCSFLADVRESLSTGVGGVERLQKKLLKDIFGKSDGEISDSSHGMNEIQRRLRNRKVFIIFDDVSESSQLKKLVGNFDFFGPGTRIIITTRDRSICEGLMRSSDNAYEMEGMSDDHALQLFSWHAFGGKWPPEDFVVSSKRVILMAGNLPLALEVIGGHLFQKKKRVWEYTMKKLERVPPKDVLNKLRISYDDLDESEKQIFLDIACFDHGGMPRKYANYMWDACGFHPDSGLDVLQNRSLIKVVNVDEDKIWSHDEKYWMHDLIREMGREIVSSESPGKHSRLWDPELALNVVRRKQGTDEVVAINLQGSDHRHFNGKEFKSMSNLRFLILPDGAEFSGKFRNFRTNLLWLRWKVDWIPRPNPAFFEMDSLAVLQISGAGITDDSMESMRMDNLRVLHMSSLDITRLPNLSRFPKLEIIYLMSCIALKEIHSSIGLLGELKRLNIFRCTSLTRLPEEVGNAKALQELVLTSCVRIRELPESIGGLRDLRILRGKWTAIRKLPTSIGNLKSLEVLEIERSILWFEIPSSESSSEVPNLARWNLSGLSSLRSLKVSGLDEVWDLVGIEKLCGLQKLTLDVHGKLDLLSTKLGSMSRLEELSLYSWDISSASQLPSSLHKLTLVGCPSRQLMRRGTSLDGRDNMRTMSYPIRFSELGSLRRLCSLHLEKCDRIDFSGVERMELLEELIVFDCCDFVGEIPELSSLRRLKRVEFYSCNSLRSVPRMVGDCHLTILDCGKLKSFYGLYQNYVLCLNKRKR